LDSEANNLPHRTTIIGRSLWRAERFRAIPNAEQCAVPRNKGLQLKPQSVECLLSQDFHTSQCLKVADFVEELGLRRVLGMGSI